MPAVTKIREFFELLKKSNLLSQQQLLAAREAVKDFTEARGLAKWLLKRDWVTSWQAQQLLNGHHRLFLGKYKLLDVIGTGGMGAVFKAEQCSVKRIVALKVMARELVRDEKAVSRFLREIQSVAALSHPNIVACIDADCIGDRYFLVMDYVEGRDLKAWLKKYGALPVSWSCEVIRQVALGLQQAHELGMVHRDIKPANIMVTVNPQTGEPHAKIMDFGLSKLVSETEADGHSTQTGVIMGSPDYIAPEQARNAKESDIRADLFGLGCTLFQLLTGQLPFPGGTIMEKLMARATAVAPPVSSLRADVPAAVNEIVARMLRLDPNERFQTPAELAAKLGSLDMNKPAEPSDPATEVAAENLDGVEPDNTLNMFLDQLSAQASDPPSSLPPTVRRAPASTWWASGIAGGCVLALFVGLAFMSVGEGKKETTNEETVRPAKKEPVKKEPAKKTTKTRKKVE
ncbi:MAG: serine/threonine-protein kinase [Planctomycetaceae bacterium]